MIKRAIILLLAFALLFTLCACKKAEARVEDTARQEQPQSQEAEQAPVPENKEETPSEPEQTENPPEAMEEDDGELWEDAYVDEGNLLDEFGESQPYSYRIPAFRGESEGAARLNERIAADCEEALQDLQAAKEENREPIYYQISYKAYRSGDYASILLVLDTRVNDIICYRTYNLNTETGREVTGPELLEIMGYSEESFRAAAIARVTDYFEETWGGFAEDEFYLAQYRKTVSADAYGDFLPFFLNNEGELNFVVPVYALAGADSYETVFSLFG